VLEPAATEAQQLAQFRRQHHFVKIECIVRGYLSGSAWQEYQQRGTVNGMPLPAGMQESEQLPTPLFTPSTKAEQGQHDDNINLEDAAAIVGRETLDLARDVSIEFRQATRARLRRVTQLGQDSARAADARGSHRRHQRPLHRGVREDHRPAVLGLAWLTVALESAGRHPLPSVSDLAHPARLQNDAPNMHALAVPGRTERHLGARRRRSTRSDR
jgi:hypothetical protein